MQETISILKLRKNRFNRSERFEEELPIKKLNFDRGLKSANIIDLNFTNMAFSENDEEYNSILNMYLQTLEEDYSYLEDFLTDELIPNDRTDRLLKIINSIQKTKYKKEDLRYFLKLDYKRNLAIHLFLKLSGSNVSILLIDLYHLAIFGQLLKNGKYITIPIEKNYKRHQKNDCSLEKIKNINL